MKNPDNKIIRNSRHNRCIRYMFAIIITIILALMFLIIVTTIFVMSIKILRVPLFTRELCVSIGKFSKSAKEILNICWKK